MVSHSSSSSVSQAESQRRRRAKRSAPSPSRATMITPTINTTRAPCFVAASSSFLLSSGLAIGSYCVLFRMDHSIDSVDYSQTGALSHSLAEGCFRWAIASAVCSALGVFGVLSKRPAVVKLFAVGTALDLVCTAVLLLVLILVTFTPTLSSPFSSFLCNALTSGEFAAASPILWNSKSRVGARGLGIELVKFGIESCEEHWRGAMCAIIIGSLVAVVLRIVGTVVTWNYHSALLKQRQRMSELCESDWTEDADRSMSKREMETMYFNDGESGQSRRRRSSTSSARSTSSRAPLTTRPSRSNTLPMLLHRVGNDEVSAHLSSLPSPSPRYTKSRTVSSNDLNLNTSASSSSWPRLVYVPVYLDENGQPASSPATPPPQYWPVPRKHRSSSSTSSIRSKSPTSSSLKSPTSSPARELSSASSVTAARPPLPSLTSHIAAASSMPVYIEESAFVVSPTSSTSSGLDYLSSSVNCRSRSASGDSFGR